MPGAENTRLILKGPGRGPRLLKPQQPGDVAGVVNERFVDSRPSGGPRLPLFGPFRKGPPLLSRQVGQTGYGAYEGNNRFIDSPLPGRVRLMNLTLHPRIGPPILVQQQAQTVFRPAGVTPDAKRIIRQPKLMILGKPFKGGPPILNTQRPEDIRSYGSVAGVVNERFLDARLPGGVRLMNLDVHPRFGPPILVQQTSQDAFATEGTNRFIDTPITHPLLKFRIGARGRQAPPIILAAQWAPAISGAGGAAGGGADVTVALTGISMSLSAGALTASVDVALLGQSVSASPGTLIASGAFPTQYSGLRVYYGGVNVELCLVAEIDAPAGMGGVLKIDKAGTNYVAYLVETTDPNASHVRVNTSTGIKAIRLKT